MQVSDTFRLIMISAGFEHGGNVTLRLFDGHPDLYVYPFESQLGNRHFVDYLSSLERFQYRYPDFSTEGSSDQDYESFFDEELKTYLRTPKRSKFRDCGLKMDESDRRARFVSLMKKRARTRGNLVAAFFESTFAAWTNYARSGRNRVYVGYCPAIGIDGDRILADFPKGHVVHVVRNPFSAYADTKLRPFPLPLLRYAASWNIYHQLALMHQSTSPDRFHVVRYEDIVGSPRKTMSQICRKAGIPFSETMLTPTFNGRDISGCIYPWGTIKQATPEANEEAARSLSSDERRRISRLTAPLMRAFGYKPR